MATVEQKIQEAASKNSYLLATLKESDYAPPALTQHNRYVADLENELQKLDKEIAKLEASREKELKDHEKYRDSVMKRFAYKVTRKQEKFEAKASKEEQEYFAALQAEHRAKESRKSTQQTLDEAKKHQIDLKAVADQHNQAQKELDALYDAIFQGPSPGFPDEDAKEQSTKTALEAYNNTRTQTEAEKQVLQNLSRAVSNMKYAEQYMAEARSHSRMDMFGGGALSDMMERSALHKAEQTTMEAQILITQAQRLSPHVNSIPRPQIAQGNLMSDVFFDNIFTDAAFHEKIKASQIEVQRTTEVIQQESNNAKLRLENLKGILNTQAHELENARSALQKAREMAFERVSAGGSGSGSGSGSGAGTGAGEYTSSTGVESSSNDQQPAPPAYQA